MARQPRDPAVEQDQAVEQSRADLAAFEAAPGVPVGTGQTAAGYIRATAPAEPGRESVEVTFVPGELLPAWAAERLKAGQARYDAGTRAWVLGPAKGKGAR